MARRRIGRVRRGGDRTGRCAGASNGCEATVHDALNAGHRTGRVADGRPRHRGRRGRRRRRSNARQGRLPGAGGRVAPGERARLLRRFARPGRRAPRRTRRSSRSRNAGHTIGNARWEAGNVRDVLNYYAGAPERLTGRQIPVPGGLDVTFHEPLGVVGIIVPWNFPDADRRLGRRPGPRGRQHGRRSSRPSSTPLTAMRLAELALEAGLPGAACSTVLPGTGARRRRSGSWPTPAVRKIVLHRLDRGRQADHAPAAPTRSSGSRWSWAARAPTSSSPTPTLPKAAARRPVRRLRQRRPGLLRPHPHPGAAAGVRPVPGTARAGGHRRCGCERPEPGHRPRWAR